MLDDSKALVQGVYEAVKDGDTNVNNPITRRQVLKGAGAAATGSYLASNANFDKKVNSTFTGGVSMVQDAGSWTANRAGGLWDWATFWDNDLLELGVENPRSGQSYENEIPYSVGINSSEDVEFDMIIDGNEVVSKTASNGDVIDGNYSQDDGGNLHVGIGASLRSQAPENINGDVSNHQEYTSFRVEYNPEDALEPGNGGSDNNGHVDERDFGFLTEEDYLDEDSRSRNRFETRLEEEFGGFLDDMHVLESGGDYFLDRENGDTDYGALRLNGDYEDNNRTVGFSESFAEDLFDLSDEERSEFTNFLEYAEERAD